MSEHDAHGEHPDVISKNARTGMILFAVYVVLYAGFMILAVFWPQLMGSTPFGGVNLAIKYGMGLILAALILAMVYLFLTRRNANK